MLLIFSSFTFFLHGEKIFQSICYMYLILMKWLHLNIFLLTYTLKLILQMKIRSDDFKFLSCLHVFTFRNIWDVVILINWLLLRFRKTFSNCVPRHNRILLMFYDLKKVLVEKCAETPEWRALIFFHSQKFATEFILLSS